MSEHSKLPWAVCGESPNPYWDSGITIYSITTDSRVADTYKQLIGAEEDAQFIVKACNSHYKLLEALREAHRQMCYAAKTEFMDDDYHEAINTARQAIKEAE